MFSDKAQDSDFQRKAHKGGEPKSTQHPLWRGRPRHLAGVTKQAEQSPQCVQSQEWFMFQPDWNDSKSTQHQVQSSGRHPSTLGPN
jgi:hypothetical protein